MTEPENEIYHGSLWASGGLSRAGPEPFAQAYFLKIIQYFSHIIYSSLPLKKFLDKYSIFKENHKGHVGHLEFGTLNIIRT